MSPAPTTQHECQRDLRRHERLASGAERAGGCAASTVLQLTRRCNVTGLECRQHASKHRRDDGRCKCKSSTSGSSRASLKRGSRRAPCCAQPDTQRRERDSGCASEPCQHDALVSIWRRSLRGLAPNATRRPARAVSLHRAPSMSPASSRRRSAARSPPRRTRSDAVLCGPVTDPATARWKARNPSPPARCRRRRALRRTSANCAFACSTVGPRLEARDSVEAVTAAARRELGPHRRAAVLRGIRRDGQPKPAFGPSPPKSSGSLKPSGITPTTVYASPFTCILPDDRRVALKRRCHNP